MQKSTKEPHKNKCVLFEKYMQANLPQSAMAARSIPRRAQGSAAPLSFGQQQMWFLSQLLADVAVYNESITVHLPGSLDIDALEQSFNEILRFDGWSWNALFQELATLYEAFSTGQPSPLPQLPIQYADFALGQREMLQEEYLAEQLTYWKQQLAGMPEGLELPTDQPCVPVPIEAIVAEPGQRLSELPFLTEKERHQLLIEWNATQVKYPKELYVHQLFEVQVDRTPEAVAVVFEEQQLTYRELNVRANQLAHHLRTLDVGPEVLVGVCVERSLDMIDGSHHYCNHL